MKQNSFKRMATLLFKHPLRLSSILIVTIGQVLLSVYLPVIVGQAIDQALFLEWSKMMLLLKQMVIVIILSAIVQWRFPPADSVPEKYEICLIEFEDRYFRYHPGVNPLSLARATRQNVKSGRVVSGGSTLTMQTVRLMRRNKRTYFEKFIEIILATRLECSFSKDRILALYASHAPMGGNVVGIDAAAWRYFGHGSHSLSWAEAATLAVLPNSPAMMHFGRDREGLVRKRNRLLRRLLDKNIIAPTDYEPLPDCVQRLAAGC